ncbi:hypothetical protein LCGC14_2394880, partial [marine sediment metagenome]
GLPGGAVAGKADIFSLMEFRDDPAWNYRQRVFHPGTFNANPLSAAAGVAMLSLVDTGRFHAEADAMTERLVRGMNEVIASRRAVGCAYGLASYFHISLGRECPRLREGIEWPLQDGKAPPRTSADATAPSGHRTTVQPVAACSSVQWPTRRPETAVIVSFPRGCRESILPLTGYSR